MEISESVLLINTQLNRGPSEMKVLGENTYNAHRTTILRIHGAVSLGSNYHRESTIVSVDEAQYDTYMIRTQVPLIV